MADSEHRLLMLIDDEPAQSRLISALAAREGWRTLIARDPETGLLSGAGDPRRGGTAIHA